MFNCLSQPAKQFAPSFRRPNTQYRPPAPPPRPASWSAWHGRRPVCPSPLAVRPRRSSHLAVPLHRVLLRDAAAAEHGGRLVVLVEEPGQVGRRRPLPARLQLAQLAARCRRRPLRVQGQRAQVGQQVTRRDVVPKLPSTAQRPLFAARRGWHETHPSTVCRHIV